MRRTETEVATAVSNVGDFLHRHDAVLGTINASGARTLLDAVDAELDRHAADQSAWKVNRQRGTVAQQTRRTARTQLQTVPDYRTLKLPNIRITSEKLVADARAMGQAAQDHDTVFVTMGLPADFVDQLNAAASLNGKARRQFVVLA